MWQRLKQVNCAMSLMTVILLLQTSGTSSWLVNAAAPTSFTSFWVQMLQSLAQGKLDPALIQI